MRAERRLYQMRKRSERIPNDLEKVLIAEVGSNFCFDETDPADNKLEGNIIGDELVYCSFDAYSVETDSDDETTRDNRRIFLIKLLKKVVWQLCMIFEGVNDFRNIGTKYSLQKGVPLEKLTNEPKKVMAEITQSFQIWKRGRPRKATNKLRNNDFNVEATVKGREKTRESVATSTIDRGMTFEPIAALERDMERVIVITTSLHVRGRGTDIGRAITTPIRGRDIYTERTSTTLLKGRVIGIGRDSTTPVRGRGIGIRRASTTTSSPARG
ncbi:hypothetical protein RDI58_013123 [Solanum bulbocastanum]|uniref:Uncharacterized protein n=1 Tax=Solanum bulbocastanum TaxID=147425 RepID=A0AAN8YDP9_SOLBU